MGRGMVVKVGMLVLAGALGCSGGSTNSTLTAPQTQPAAQPPAQQAGSASASIAIADFSFGPQDVTVAAGGTVTWTNNGAVQHTATSDGSEFDSGNLGNKASFSHTFNTRGTYAYHCSIHSGMTGTITVQ